MIYVNEIDPYCAQWLQSLHERRRAAEFGCCITLELSRDKARSDLASRLNDLLDRKRLRRYGRNAQPN